VLRIPGLGEEEVHRDGGILADAVEALAEGSLQAPFAKALQRRQGAVERASQRDVGGRNGRFARGGAGDFRADIGLPRHGSPDDDVVEEGKDEQDQRDEVQSA
jgi:hypothetical protein